MRRVPALLVASLLAACASSHTPAPSSSGTEDARDAGTDAPTGALEIECARGWPHVVYASVRLDCASDGREALRMIVTPTPHGCDDVLDGPRFDLLGWERPAPETFRSWYDEPLLVQGEARFCDGDACEDVVARWQMEIFHLGATSLAGYAVICEDSSASGPVDAIWCGPTTLACP